MCSSLLTDILLYCIALSRPLLLPFIKMYALCPLTSLLTTCTVIIVLVSYN